MIFKIEFNNCPYCGDLLEIVWNSSTQIKLCVNKHCVVCHPERLIATRVQELKNVFETQLQELHQKIDDLSSDVGITG